MEQIHITSTLGHVGITGCGTPVFSTTEVGKYVTKIFIIKAYVTLFPFLYLMPFGGYQSIFFTTRVGAKISSFKCEMVVR